jgi:hypothetical protein
MTRADRQRARRAQLAKEQGRTVRPRKASGIDTKDKAAYRREYKRMCRRKAGATPRVDIQAATQAKREAQAPAKEMKAANALHSAHVQCYARILAVRRKQEARNEKRSARDTKEELLTADQLRKLLSYNPETGVFHWRVGYSNVSAGDVAGYATAAGYLVVGLFGEKFRMHRLAWLHVHGRWPTGTVDHIDTDRTNSRIANLRDVTQAINTQNRRNPTKANTSGLLGVYWSARRKGFMASVSLNKKKKRRGPYKTAERAYAAYVELKRMHHEGCTL